MSTPEDSETSSKGSDRVPAFSEVHVIEVNRENFEKIWPYLLICVKSADFTAMDLEFSGLNSKGLRNRDVEERYKSIRECAHTRSILSVGIACMKLTHKNEKRHRLRYETQVFNILTLSEKPFTIEPDALQFLARHSFDFNRLIQSGVQFQGANCPLKTLFHELLSSSATFCLHNGFIDLAFIHKQLYGVELPETLDEFVNNLSDLFPAEFLPLADSKYLAEYQSRMKSSFLEFVFRRSQGDNEIDRQASRIHIDTVFPDTTSLSKPIRESIEKVDVKLPEDFPNHPIPIDLHIHVCKNFASHGFCHQRTTAKGCAKWHDVDAAIDLARIAENKKAFKRKRRFSKVIAESAAEKIEADQEAWKAAKFEKELLTRDFRNQQRNVVTGSHRAGVDAFMTVFAVVYQQRASLWAKDQCDGEFTNRIPLSAKDIPLHIRRRQVIEGKSDGTDHKYNMKVIEKRREYVRKNAVSNLDAEKN